jgi:ElaB/YqjD/DUF883 family membrane-anchored ribosome-binding protein
MQEQRHRADEIVDNSPMTQQSGYTPASDMPSGQPPRDATDGMGNRARDTANQAKDKASELGQKAQQQADMGKDKAAGGMESAADKIREQASKSDGMTAQTGTKVADSMEKTAGYLREHDTTEMLDDVEQYVKDHPMQAVAGAVIGGFVIGRILR